MADFSNPYASDYLQRGQNIANMGYTPFGQSTQVAANPWQQTAWQNTFNRGATGSAEVSAARGQLTDTINGGGFTSNPYLNSQNPELQSTIDSTLGDITRNYNLNTKPQIGTAQVRSGSFGNSGLQEMQMESQRQLAGELGRAASGIRYQDYTNRAGLYENERNRQQQATLGAPAFSNVDYTDLQAMQQAGNALQGQQQAERTAGYNAYLDAREWPFKTYGAYSQAMGNGGTQTATPQPQANRGANALGGALAGAQLGQSLGIGSGWGAGIGGLLGLF